MTAVHGYLISYYTIDSRGVCSDNLSAVEHAYSAADALTQFRVRVRYPDDRAVHVRSLRPAIDSDALDFGRRLLTRRKLTAAQHELGLHTDCGPECEGDR